MGEVVVDSSIDSIKERVSRAEKLADEITEDEYRLAMLDRDGVIPVRLVEEHQRIVDIAGRAERSALCDRVEASRRLGVVAKPSTIAERVTG
jgi:hypothetical protein